MQTEIEAKFLHVDHDKLRAQLKASGARQIQPMRLMRRYNFDYPDRKLQNEVNGWIRVRDEGDKVTLSYKQLNDRTLHGTKEVCVTVDSFDQTKALLEAIGIVPTSYQETKRESWVLDGVEVELDHWPWTKPYIEMEGETEEKLRKVAKQLDLDWTTAVHGSVEIVYRAEYDITDEDFYTIDTFRFEEDLPKLLMDRRRK